MNNIIELRNLTFGYEDKTILNNISCTIKEGDFTALIGKNGAGKSTLLNIILGNLKNYSGDVILFGDDIKKNNHHSDISYISQNKSQGYKNFPTSVEEALKIHTSFLKKKESISKYLEMVGLINHKKKALRELSGGQLQRLSLALALIKDAKLILLDEPTASIDDEFAIEFFNLLKSFSKKGKTILLVSHDLSKVKDFADNIIEIEKGSLKFIKEENKNA